MEITIKINGQAVSVEVSYEVYECLEESKRKTENLAHQKRRHWDKREFDEYIIATECRHIYNPLFPMMKNEKGHKDYERDCIQKMWRLFSSRNSVIRASHKATGQIRQT